MKRENIVGLLPFYLLAVILFIGIAAGGSRAVTVVAENESMENRTKFVIDAGHGGVDGGATSCTGVLESQINLQIAWKLNDLCRLLGYQTRMIRTGDVSVYTAGNTIAAKKASDLRQRVAMVNETEGGILISIHQNNFSDGRYDGPQVLYAETPGSRELAEIIQSMLTDTLKPNNRRQIKEGSGIYLMQHIQKPGILIECGFLSNPEEEAKLRTSHYQNYICCAIVAGLSQYINA